MTLEKPVSSEGSPCEIDLSLTGFLRRPGSGALPSRWVVACNSSGILVAGRDVSTFISRNGIPRSHHSTPFNSTVLKLLSPIRPPSNARTSPVPPLSPSKSHHNNGCPTFGSPSFPYDSESSSDSSMSSPPTPTEAHTALQCLLYRGIEPRGETIPSTIVYIDLLARQIHAPITGQATWTSSSNAQMEERSWVERGFKIERASQQPRYLSDIDPTITLTSKTPISAQSHFTVHTDDGVLFSETTTLELLDPSTVPGIDESFLYRTRLIPGFWETVLHSSGKLDFFRVYYHTSV